MENVDILTTLCEHSRHESFVLSLLTTLQPAAKLLSKQQHSSHNVTIPPITNTLFTRW